MSSTNRSKERDKHIADYYVTPIKDIELFLRKFDDVYKNYLMWQYMNILDPCGGNPEKKDENGILECYHPMSYPAAIVNMFGEKYNIKIEDIDTYDIREDSLAKHHEDYLKAKLNYKLNLIISNPPFNQASLFIEKALNHVDDNGFVVMLLRLNFFGSKERKSFFDKHMPETCFVHHQRIGFADKKDSSGYVLFDKDGNPKRGSTDSIEYCHMVFRKNIKPEYTKLYLI